MFIFSSKQSIKYLSLVYYNLVGGVLALNLEQLNKTNGFSNLYWGWGNLSAFNIIQIKTIQKMWNGLKGAEDDDMSMRLGKIR